jgi:hypothetical protein
VGRGTTHGLSIECRHAKRLNDEVFTDSADKEAKMREMLATMDRQGFHDNMDQAMACLDWLHRQCHINALSCGLRVDVSSALLSLPPPSLCAQRVRRTARAQGAR